MRGQQIFDLRVPDTETGRTFLSVDWSRSPLGPITDWPHSLRTAVQICLNSQFPMTLAWGDHLANFYNDGYLPIDAMTRILGFLLVCIGMQFLISAGRALSILP